LQPKLLGEVDHSHRVG